jgi:single-strand DNA-binding protein
MYALRNKVQLIGHLGKNPEIKIFESGRKKASFSIATNETYRNAKGEKVEETHWHNVIAWGKLAEIAEKHFVKGKQLALEGKLVSRSYNDKDGSTKYISEIVMNEFEFIGSKAKTE